MCSLRERGGKEEGGSGSELFNQKHDDICMRNGAGLGVRMERERRRRETGGRRGGWRLDKRGKRPRSTTLNGRRRRRRKGGEEEERRKGWRECWRHAHTRHVLI